MKETWYARQTRCDGYITHVVSLDDEPVEDEFYYGRNIAVALSGQNAALVAAAPDLLAACEAMVQEIEKLFGATAKSGMLSGYESARAAITKASTLP